MLAARPQLRIPTERRLFDSLERACKRALVDSGFQLDKVDASERGAYLCAYCRILHRSISVKPRTVKRSREFQAQMDAETNRELRARVETVEEEMRKGLNLNVRLTRQFYDASFNDPLLNDLNVQHFHLGKRSKHPDKLCKTSQELLFGVVDQDTIRLVHLGDHKSFERIAFEQVMFDNWPELFKELSGIQPTREPWPNAERDVGRRVGLTMPIQINGKVYWAPWSGQSSAGTSIQANNALNQLIHQVRVGRAWVLERSDWVFDSMLKHGRSDRTLPLEVQVDGLTVWLVDLVQGIWMCPTRAELRFGPTTNVVQSGGAA